MLRKSPASDDLAEVFILYIYIYIFEAINPHSSSS